MMHLILSLNGPHNLSNRGSCSGQRSLREWGVLNFPKNQTNLKEEDHLLWPTLLLIPPW